MNAYALKAPVQDWKVPAWVTPHNLVLIAGGTVAGLVIILLASAVRRLSKGSAPAPAPAAKPSGGGGKVLLLVLAVGAAIFGYAKLGHPAVATAPKAGTPAPSPSPTPHPTPHPTVTQTVAPHFTNYHFPLTGSQILIGLAVVAVVGYLMVRVVARNAS